MSESGMSPRSPLLDSGSTPFRVQAPTEVHDFEIFASLSRQLRGGLRRRFTTPSQ